MYLKQLTQDFIRCKSFPVLFIIIIRGPSSHYHLHVSKFIFTKAISTFIFFCHSLLCAASFFNTVRHRNINKYTCDLLWEFSPQWREQSTVYPTHRSSNDIANKSSPWRTNKFIEFIYWTWLRRYRSLDTVMVWIEVAWCGISVCILWICFIAIG